MNFRKNIKFIRFNRNKMFKVHVRLKSLIFQPNCIYFESYYKTNIKTPCVCCGSFVRFIATSSNTHIYKINAAACSYLQ